MPDSVWHLIHSVSIIDRNETFAKYELCQNTQELVWNYRDNLQQCSPVWDLSIGNVS